MDFEKLEQIKKLAIIAVFSDDSLMDTLVLKGGNALDIIYKISSRASIDLDFSIEKDFDSIDEFEKKISVSLNKTFNEENYEVFDIVVKPKPKTVSPQTPVFWGGYIVEFKIIEKENYNKHKADLSQLRNMSTVIGLKQKKTFSIDISKYEFCENKQESDLDGYTIYVYSPEMIVFEKIRAICQQMPEYTESIGKSYQTARARDFFDIYGILTNTSMELDKPENLTLLKNIFEQKKVDLELLEKIKDTREFHRPDFSAVQDTVKPSSVKLEEFDFYFDYVVEICKTLHKSLGEI